MWYITIHGTGFAPGSTINDALPETVWISAWNREYEEDGVCFTDETSSQKTPFTRRQALGYLEHWLHKYSERSAQLSPTVDLSWVTPNFNTWTFDLDKMRRSIPELAELTWLMGKIDVEPEIENEQDGDSRHPNTGTRIAGNYKAKVKFYILKEEMRRYVMHVQIPDAIKGSLTKFQTEHPDPTKVAFIMMRYGSTADHEAIVKAIRDTVATHGITALRADDKEYHTDQLPNIQTYMHGCGFGIAVFERIEGDEFNPNVALEVGYMMALSKPVCLLKDSTLKHLHSDLLGKLYRSFDTRSPKRGITKKLTSWLEDWGMIPKP